MTISAVTIATGRVATANLIAVAHDASVGSMSRAANCKMSRLTTVADITIPTKRQEGFTCAGEVAWEESWQREEASGSAQHHQENSPNTV